MRQVHREEGVVGVRDRLLQWHGHVGLAGIVDVERRLCDVEEAIDLPNVSERVRQIREDLSKMQREFIRHSKEPEWDLVEMQMLKPINELRRQLAEELSKIKSDKALVPIDRDPVPDAFDELVRRYYLRLGKGE